MIVADDANELNVGVPFVTVSPCVAVPVTVVVSVGLPATVSRYLKLAVLLPEAMLTVAMVFVSVESRKDPPLEVVAKLTVWPPPPAFTALPNWSWS